MVDCWHETLDLDTGLCVDCGKNPITKTRVGLYMLSYPLFVTNPRSTFRMLAPDPICDVDLEEIASDIVAAYRRMHPNIRRAWLRSARPKMSKRAWRRLRGKVKGLKL